MMTHTCNIALGRLRQEDVYVFESSLSYLMNSRLAGLQTEILFPNEIKTEQHKT